MRRPIVRRHHDWPDAPAHLEIIELNRYFGTPFKVWIQDAIRIEECFPDDLRQHRVLKTASFIRRNMQGQGLLASQYRPYLYLMIHGRNPAARKVIARYSPENL